MVDFWVDYCNKCGKTIARRDTYYENTMTCEECVDAERDLVIQKIRYRSPMFLSFGPRGGYRWVCDPSNARIFDYSERELAEQYSKRVKGTIAKL